MTKPDKTSLTNFIKLEAKKEGFYGCGISKARNLDIQYKVLKKYLERNSNGTMKWLERNPEKRTNPKKVLNGAKSVISFIHNYYSDHKQEHKNVPRISRYAYARDYHDD